MDLQPGSRKRSHMPELIFEEGAYDPADFPQEMTTEWVARWHVLCERLIGEAQRRGGTGRRSGYTVRLHAPGDGECLTIRLLEPEAALVQLLGRTLSAAWELADGHPNANLEQIVKAVMDGNARLLTSGEVHVWYDGGSIGEPTSDGEQVAAWS
jgi:hypothetical protein